MHNIIEIKWRIQYILIGILSNILICYYYKNNFINICLQPLKTNMGNGGMTVEWGDILISTSIPEVFIVTLVTIMKYSLIIIIPIVYYNILVYMKSGLYQNEYKEFKQILFISFIFYIFGIVITCAYILPFGLTFFINEIINMHIVFTPQLSTYIGFIGNILLYALIAFQVPVFFVTIVNIGSHLTPSRKPYKKYIYFTFILISTIVTPPDVFSQIFLSTIFIIVFEFLTFCQIWLRAKRAKRCQ